MSDPVTPAGDGASRERPTALDRVLMGLFWLWAGLLLLATLSHLLGWDAVLAALDVKRWF